MTDRKNVDMNAEQMPVGYVAFCHVLMLKLGISLLWYLKKCMYAQRHEQFVFVSKSDKN